MLSLDVFVQNESPRPHKHLEARITGRVQMVMYRDFAQRKARKLGLFGTVQNIPDGSVHVAAEGEEEKLNQYLTLLHEGSILAKVKDVEARWLPATGEFQDFKIIF